MHVQKTKKIFFCVAPNDTANLSDAKTDEMNTLHSHLSVGCSSASLPPTPPGDQSWPCPCPSWLRQCFGVVYNSSARACCGREFMVQEKALSHRDAACIRIGESRFPLPTVATRPLLSRRYLVIHSCLGWCIVGLCAGWDGQGAPESGWILLDYGDIIVHIMTPKSRSYYDLDSFWSNGELVDTSAVVMPNVVETEQLRDEDLVSALRVFTSSVAVFSFLHL